ncbi:MAG: hypothetical protein ACTHYX_05440, partial [Psychrobacter sp.]|uniref:hypothetical protein n=1 Tax=Psychrobacter sp. TaxID=56811 RepID=UPI002653CDCC|nr:hypothetical protein [Psychrobacter sp.]MDN6308693.1 hypothetical protein [Psychrobacter sp.]
MQQFQSLQRLLFFYALTLLVTLILYYFTLFHDMKSDNEQDSIHTFRALQYEITKHKQGPEPFETKIEEVLEHPSLTGVSYQLIVMMPSGQTYIHRHTRPNEPSFSTVTFPTVRASSDSSSIYMTPAVKSVHINLGDFNYAA